MLSVFRRVVFLLLLLTVTRAHADLLSATIAYQNNDYSTAKSEFTALAKLGNADALFNLGVMSLHGQGGQQSFIDAYAWFSLAAEFGLEQASSTANLVYQKISQVEVLKQRQAELTSEFGFQRYQRTLAPVFVKQNHAGLISKVERIHVLTPNYPETAYKKGIEGWVWVEFDIDASGAVKDLEIIDSYPDKQFNRAIFNAVSRWQYEPIETDGLPEQFASRSLIYHFTTHKGQRYQQSFKRQRQQYQNNLGQMIERAEQGDAVVQYYAANWLLSDKHNAAKMLQMHWNGEHASSELLLNSAQNGYANAQYRLGANLLRGNKTQADREKGLNWVLSAAQSGYAVAQYRLGYELLQKETLEFDQEKAKAWLIEAAKQNHFRAQRDLVDLLIAQQQWQSADQYVDLALQQDADHPDLLLAKAHIAFALKQASSASEYWQKAKLQYQQRSWSTHKLVKLADQLRLKNSES